MIKKVLFIIFVVLLIAGCKPVEKPAEVTPEEATGQSISEADDITGIEDAEAEQELDEMGSLLGDW